MKHLSLNTIVALIVIGLTVTPGLAGPATVRPDPTAQFFYLPVSGSTGGGVGNIDRTGSSPGPALL